MNSFPWAAGYDLPREDMHVLLCEDCVDQGRLILKLLQLARFEVTLECNGQSAVDAIKKDPHLYQAVVMDFQMPKMDGLVATQLLRQLGYGGRIIAVTAHGSEKLRRDWFAAGCDVYLQKPLTREELVDAIQARMLSPAMVSV